MAGDERRAEAEAAGRELAKVNAGAWPNVAWAGAAMFGGSAADRFEFGLAALLDGIAARLAAPPAG